MVRVEGGKVVGVGEGRVYSGVPVSSHPSSVNGVSPYIDHNINRI